MTKKDCKFGYFSTAC